GQRNHRCACCNSQTPLQEPSASLIRNDPLGALGGELPFCGNSGKINGFSIYFRSEQSWQGFVTSAARGRNLETTSATRTTSPSGAGTSICARCAPAWAPPPSACGFVPPACVAAKW